MRGRLMIIQVQRLNHSDTLLPLDHTLDYLLHIVEARTALIVKRFVILTLVVCTVLVPRLSFTKNPNPKRGHNN